MPLNIIQDLSELIRRQSPATIGRTIRDLGMAAIDPIKEPQLAYMWEVSISGGPTGGSGNMTFYAKGTSIPQISNDAIKRRYRGKEYAWSGLDNSSKTFRITLYDNAALDNYHYFQKWMFDMNDPVERMKVTPTNYLRKITLDMKDRTDLLINERFTFDGCFPTEISDAVLSYDSSNEMMFDVMFYFHDRITGMQNTNAFQGLGF